MVGVRNGRSESEDVAIMRTDENCKGNAADCHGDGISRSID